MVLWWVHFHSWFKFRRSRSPDRRIYQNSYDIEACYKKPQWYAMYSLGLINACADLSVNVSGSSIEWDYSCLLKTHTMTHTHTHRHHYTTTATATTATATATIRSSSYHQPKNYRYGLTVLFNTHLLQLTDPRWLNLSGFFDPWEFIRASPVDHDFD